MIRNLIFDFGDVFINLDKGVVLRAIPKWGGHGIPLELMELNNRYEVGRISSEAFISGLKKAFPKATTEDIKQVWNAMLLDFPEDRLEFIEALSRAGQYRCFLLSNTNALHIAHVQKTMGIDRYRRFKDSFERFYLSHEIHLRKPDAEIFEFVLGENNLKPQETLFIDDTRENTDAAQRLGLHVWNLRVGKEDVIQLTSKLQDGLPGA